MADNIECTFQFHSTETVTVRAANLIEARDKAHKLFKGDPDKVYSITSGTVRDLRKENHPPWQPHSTAKRSDKGDTI